MSEHGNAVFNNSCLRVPRNPVNKTPFPVCDQKLINQLENEARKLSISPTSSTGSADHHKSLIDFYDSIPEYNEVNHLSNKEFYKRLENLRQKQRTYNDYLVYQDKIENHQTAWIDDYKTLSTGRTPDTERKSTAEEEWESKSPSRRSVRIETPPTEIRFKPRCESADIKSVPNSPRKVAWKDCGITIPKPFQMTIRSETVKKRSKDQLRAQMRPFSFTRREEEILTITKRLSKSSPSIFSQETCPKVKQFSAKPVPRNLFSNYVYQKMHEDEFYRSLQKKIRAEEMLKASSLPPAMAKREKTKPKYQICPRSFRDLYLNESNGTNTNFDKELAELELDFVLRTPSPRQCKKKARKSCRKSPSICRSVLDSTNRSNLAAVLRMQTARKRMEDDIARRLEEVKIKEEVRWREKVLRRRPVWQTLAYNHEEDLQMRLQLRKEEDKLRNEEHKYKMQKMQGRVNRQPTLFERQSQIRNAKTREELIARLYGNLERSCENSNYNENDSVKRSVVEMKDESIQAQFDEIFRDEESAAIKGTEVVVDED
ncbi:PREDICTED: protein FAM161A [Nicrophorus vespilloides]|uniref:Protein FAM161A n=1 Tax=Nicrophorus vespilloides TaxID=110193 RepID=A0ABM1MKT1_NICVS|nr:PREDICTED: protein FAM161A [Nicrophorus vespilloides]